MVGKIATFAVCAAVSYAGWRYINQRPPLRFETRAVERGDLQQHVTATGSFSPLETEQVGVQVSGLDTAVYADFNTPVHKGQVLALIDPGPFQVQLTEAKASADNANAAVTAARASLNGAKANVKVAQQQLASQKQLAQVARTQEEYAKLELDRSQRSNKAGAVSQDDALTAKTTFDIAEDDYEVAQHQIDSATAMISQREAEVDQAAANLDSAQADASRAQKNVELAQVNLAYTEIKSPIDGIVLARNINAGETVASSMVAPVLFQLVRNLDKMQVDVNLDESDIGQVKAGQQAQFTVDSYPGQTFEATVRQVRQQATNVQNVISYDTVLDVINPGGKLLPGMTANITIRTAHAENIIKIPSSALRYRPDDVKTKLGTAVYTLGPNNHPVAHPIKTGISDGKFAQLLDGDLKEGDALIVATN
jgi:HlyD family secretion protein